MQELRIQRAGFALAASYSGAGETALVALHGASEGTRDSPLYRNLHALLPPAGIGVVSFDRRGEGASSGDSTRGRFALQVEDALAVRDAIPAGRVGFWGYSQGGWIGPMVAAASEAVAFLVLVASTGVTPAEQMLYAVDRQLRLAGYPPHVVDRALDLRRRFHDWVRGGGSEPDEQLAAELRASSAEPWWSRVWLPEVLLGQEDRRLWVEEMDFDPRPVFAEVEVPTLLFYGEEDSWTPIGPSIKAWRAARGDQIDVVVIPGAAHDLTLPGGALSPEYQQTLVRWLVNLQT